MGIGDSLLPVQVQPAKTESESSEISDERLKPKVTDVPPEVCPNCHKVVTTSEELFEQWKYRALIRDQMTKLRKYYESNADYFGKLYIKHLSSSNKIEPTENGSDVEE